MKREIKVGIFTLVCALSLTVRGAEGFKNEEPSETEIRRLQTQLNILDSRIADPTVIEQRRVMQDKLFEKIRRMHDNTRQEKDLVGGIEARKHAEATQQAERPVQHGEQPKITTSSKDETPVAPLKVTPPQPRTTTAVPSTAPSSTSRDEDVSDIYRSIINYSSTNSAPRSVK
jgi:hypothetical protein